MKIIMAGAAVGGIILTFLLAFHKWIPAIWVGVGIVCLIAIEAGLFIQDWVWKREEAKAQASTKSELDSPTFQEIAEKVLVSIGDEGITVEDSLSNLRAQKHTIFQFGDAPIIMYAEDNRLYIDLTLYNGKQKSPVEIRRNEFLVRPKNWDRNSNKNALEVVNEAKVPVFQLIYKTPFHIVLRGVFPYPSGFLIAGEAGPVRGTSSLPAVLPTKRIFKYPSWKYPGQYAED